MTAISLSSRVRTPFGMGALLALLGTLALATLFPAPSRATPEDHVVITDTLFGVGDGKLFLLRSATDNLGLHMAWRSETWLVALDPETGEETLWPVHAAVSSTDWDQETGKESWVTTPDARDGAVDPFAVLAEHNGMPILDRNHALPEDTAEVREAGANLEVIYSNDRSYRAERQVVENRYRKSVEALAEQIVDYRRMGGIATRDLYLQSVSPEADCRFETFGWPLWLNAEGPAYQAVRVTCPPFEYMESHSLIQLLPQGKNHTVRR